MNNSSYQSPLSSKAAKYFWHLISGAIIIFLVTSSFTAYLKNCRLENYIRALDAEIVSIEKENANLERQVHAISYDPVYREAVIRRDLKLGLPGEVVIRPR